jgi:exopolysaccharide biosynthesis protein
MYTGIGLRFCLVWFSRFLFSNSFSQYKWMNVDAEFGDLPASMHVFVSTDSIDGMPSIAYYARVKLNDKKLQFTTDSSYKRRLTPSQFFEKNGQPLLVVNGTFFDFASNRNLNVLIRDGKLIAYNVHDLALKGKDSGSFFKVTRSAIGIRNNGKADVAWLFTDSTLKNAVAFQKKPSPWKDNSKGYTKKDFERYYGAPGRKWKMKTAIGGGPVLVQDGMQMITNDEERMFTGKAMHDRHPRTAMGYTADGDLIVLVVEGRNKGIAEGASLVHLANILVELGCVEALNLDGGGSSCMLVNGKQTIKPSDKEGQRQIPGVFIVTRKR